MSIFRSTHVDIRALVFTALATVACDASNETPREDTGDDRDTLPRVTCLELGCPETSAPYCDAERTHSYRIEQVCEDRGDGPRCHPTEVATRCEPATGSLCLMGECVVAPGRHCDWPIGDNTSIIHWIAFSGMGDVVDPVTGRREDSCCRDFDGDGIPDHGWIDATRALFPVVGDPNEALANQIQAGRGLTALDVRGLDDVENDDYVEIIGYFAIYTATSPGKAADGNSIVRVQPSSFRPGTFLPVLSAIGKIEDGYFRSTSGRWAVVTRGGGFNIELLAHDFALEGQVTLGPEGKGLIFSGRAPLGGMMSGYFKRDELFRGLNIDMLSQCSCRSTGPDGAPFDPARGTCYPPADPSCVDPIPHCAFLFSDMCPAFIDPIQPDYDADGDGLNDSFTLGMTLETAPTRVLPTACNP